MKWIVCVFAVLLIVAGFVFYRILKPAQLARFNATVWNNSSGDPAARHRAIGWVAGFNGAGCSGTHC